MANLIRVLRASYPIFDVVGHSEVSPGRKTDPGPCFDWPRLAAHFSLKSIVLNRQGVKALPPPCSAFQRTWLRLLDFLTQSDVVELRQGAICFCLSLNNSCFELFRLLQLVANGKGGTQCPVVRRLDAAYGSRRRFGGQWVS